MLVEVRNDYSSFREGGRGTSGLLLEGGNGSGGEMGVEESERGRGSGRGIGIEQEREIGMESDLVVVGALVGAERKFCF
jgi:hypothetical protein